jgi:hypothetical protein
LSNSGALEKIFAALGIKSEWYLHAASGAPQAAPPMFLLQTRHSINQTDV